MRIGKLFTLAVIFAIAGIAFTACDNGTGIGSDTDISRSTDAGEKIIGTWLEQIDDTTYTWIFKADGNLTRDEYDYDYDYDVEGIITRTYKFGVIDTQLFIVDPRRDFFAPHYSNVCYYNIYLSPNGKTLLLDGGNDYYHRVLTKK